MPGEGPAISMATGLRCSVRETRSRCFSPERPSQKANRVVMASFT